MSIPRWERYKQFFQIAVLRYLVVWFSMVPVIAKLLDGLPRPLKFTIGENPVALQLALPFSWELLWFSSFLFFLALALYHWRCPDFIKRFNSFSEYALLGNNPRWLSWEASKLPKDEAVRKKFVERMLTKKFIQEVASNIVLNDPNPSVEEKQTKWHFQLDGRTFVLAMPPLDVDGKIQVGSENEIFWEIFGRFSEARGGSRLAIYILLILSLILFLTVLLEHITFGLGAFKQWVHELITHAYLSWPYVR